MALVKLIWDSPIVKCFTMIFFLVVNFFVPSKADELKDIGFKDSADFGVFYSLQTILDTLDETKYRGKAKVHQLLSVFERHCQPRNSKPLSPRRPYPFIVIEGAQRTGRRILGKALAKSIGAKMVGGVPRCLIKLRNQFDTESELKRTFFGLSNYITAFNVRHMLENMPVVLVGYWMDQATFNIAKEYPDELPPASSIIYKFPTDLLEPDIIFYLNTPREELQGNFNDQDFNKKIVDIYRRMREPNVTEIQSKYITDEFINQLRYTVRRRLQPKFTNLVL